MQRDNGLQRKVDTYAQEYTAKQATKRKAQVAGLEISINAVGVIAIIYGMIFLGIGYSIPYYQENGGIAGFWGFAALFWAGGLWAIVHNIKSD